MKKKIYKLIILIFIMGLVIITLIKITTGAPVTVTNYVTRGDQDGFVRENGWVEDGFTRARVGDNAANLELQGFIGINVDSIPAGAVIVSATLNFWVNFINSGGGGLNNPYWLSLVDFGTGIEFGDFDTPGDICPNGFGDFVDFVSFNITTDNVWVSVPVTTALQFALYYPKGWNLNGSDQWFQVKMRADIPTDGDNATDFAVINNIESGTIPYLAITYDTTLPPPIICTNCPAPTIDGFGPSSGCIGDTVIINGSGFLDSIGTVNLNGAPTVSYSGWGPDQISIKIEAGSTGGQITVINSCGSNFTTSSNFFIPVLTINGFSPSLGCEGDTLTITGFGFGIPSGSVTMGGNNASISLWEESQIQVIVPANGSGTIAVVNDCGSFATTGPFDIPIVNITGFDPELGCEGGILTITGTGFGTGGTVTMNGNNASIDNWTDTEIRVIIPANGAGTIEVTDGLCGLTDTAGPFEMLALNITGFSPSYGCEGAALTITGSGFGAIPYIVTNILFTNDDFEDNNLNEYDDTSGCDIESASPITGNYSGRINQGGALMKSINATGNNNIRVTFTLRVDADANNERGELQYSINGAGGPFNMVGNWNKNDLVVSVTVTLPAAADGQANLVIQWNEGGNFESGDYWVIDDVEITGEETIGAGGSEGAVMIGGVPAAVNIWSDTNIIVTVPSGGSGPVFVSNYCGNNETTISSFTILVVDITGFSPSVGCAGDTLTITGSGFGYGTPPGIVVDTRFSDDFEDNNLDEYEIKAFEDIAGGGAQINGSFSGRYTSDAGDNAYIGKRIDATGYSNIQVTFNYDVTCGGGERGVLQYSTDDGVIYNDLNNLNNAGTLSITLPADANNQNDLVIRWFSSGFDNEGENVIIDDIQITGERPGGWIGTGIVTIGGIEAPIISWENTNIIVTVPVDGDGEIYVTNICGSSDTTNPGFTLSCDVTLGVSKFISDVSLGGSSISGPIPGSTVIYTVSYTNKGSMDANNMIIYDQLPANAIYDTMSPSGAWTREYSEQAPPDQSWGSPEYASIPPPVASNVRWIRWINPSVPAGESGSMTYTVIVK